MSERAAYLRAVKAARRAVWALATGTNERVDLDVACARVDAAERAEQAYGYESGERSEPRALRRLLESAEASGRAIRAELRESELRRLKDEIKAERHARRVNGGY